MLRQKNRGIVCARDELHARGRLADIRLKRPRQIRKSIGKLLLRKSGEGGSRGGLANNLDNCGTARVSRQNADSQNGQYARTQRAAKPDDSPRAFRGRRNTSQVEKPRLSHCRRMVVVEPLAR